MSVVRTLFLFLIIPALYATSVRPPSFDELVDRSELIFRGHVVATNSGWNGEGQTRRIVTRVTFQIERTLKGNAAETLTLEFLGGEIDGSRIEILGMPTWKREERGIFFVENRAARICPLFRFRYGRYRIVPDAGAEARVFRDDLSPVVDVATIRKPLSERSEPSRAAAPATPGLTISEFESRVSTRLSAIHPKLMAP